MNPTLVFHVARDFSAFPGGRKREHGPNSGEQFWEEITQSLLEENEFIVFDLTGTKGYSSGFLDVAFGEIGRKIGLAEARRRVKFIAEDDDLAVDTTWLRIEEAAKEAGKT